MKYLSNRIYLYFTYCTVNYEYSNTKWRVTYGGAREAVGPLSTRQVHFAVGLRVAHDRVGPEAIVRVAERDARWCGQVNYSQRNFCVWTRFSPHVLRNSKSRNLNGIQVASNAVDSDSLVSRVRDMNLIRKGSFSKRASNSSAPNVRAFGTCV